MFVRSGRRITDISWNARSSVACSSGCVKITSEQAVPRYVRLLICQHWTLLRYHSPSLQNFRALAGSCRNENFCKSAYVSVSKPKINIPVPVESRCVIVFGALGWECLGELTIITGSETTNTHTACWWGKKDNRSLDRFLVLLFSPGTSKKRQIEWRFSCCLRTACLDLFSRCDTADMQTAERPIHIRTPSPWVVSSRSAAKKSLEFRQEAFGKKRSRREKLLINDWKIHVPFHPRCTNSNKASHLLSAVRCIYSITLQIIHGLKNASTM